MGRILSRTTSRIKEGKIVLLGSSGAGKTTLVRYLETGEPVKEDAKTTLGIDIRQKPIILDGWSLKAIDVGGQELYQRTFWSLGAAQADAVIYVIDGTVQPGSLDTTWEKAQFQFEYMLNLVGKNVPLLILINKQDLKELNPLTTTEAITLYHMNEIMGRSFTVLPSSAKYGDGVKTALEWLVDKMESTKK
ncbi:MAG: ADP-ribosylation factor-like protein [Candidatus Hodarchaeota archaeon]